jgi:hypothetical protein
MKAIIERHRGSVISGFLHLTNILVIVDNPGHKKVLDAHEYGLPIVELDQLTSIIINNDKAAQDLFLAPYPEAVMAILTQNNIQVKRPPPFSDLLEHCSAAGNSMDKNVHGHNGSAGVGHRDEYGGDTCPRGNTWWHECRKCNCCKGGERPSRSRWSAQHAALYRCNCCMLEKDTRKDRRNKSTHSHAHVNSQLRQFLKVGYKDAKTWMEWKLASMKSGVPNWAATAIAEEWQSGMVPDFTDLNEGIAEIEAANLEKHYARRHVPRLRHINPQRPDGIFHILGGQLNSTLSLEVRTRKVEDVLRLINNWKVQAGCLLEMGVNWSTYPLPTNLASWF